LFFGVFYALNNINIPVSELFNQPVFMGGIIKQIIDLQLNISVKVPSGSTLPL
jgi:hypothetical protein